MLKFLPLIIVMLWAISAHAHEGTPPPAEPWNMLVYSENFAITYGPYDGRKACEEARGEVYQRGGDYPTTWMSPTLDAQCFERPK